MNNTQNPVKKNQTSTVIKALEILKIIGMHEVSASEICQLLSMNKTTAHRLLLTLQNENFIERNESTKKYRIGLKMVELCSSRLADVEVISESRPYLSELAQTVQKPVHLGIYSAGNAVYVDKIDILPRIHMYSQIGKTIPVHCSALGKALLFHRTDKEILTILNQYGMATFTSNTITDPTLYLTELAEARENGFSTDNGEHEDNVSCIGAPIYNYRGEIIAAISISGYAQHETISEHAVANLIHTAKQISQRLGWVEKNTNKKSL